MEGGAQVEGDSGCGNLELMRKQLTEFGFKEEDLCKEEMSDLLKALRYSKSSATQEEKYHGKPDEAFMNDSSGEVEPNNNLPRRYRAVMDRRLPWCLLPTNLTTAQKIGCLAAYIRLSSINQYVKARSLSKFEVWPTPRHIASGSPSRGLSTRATRSGRSAPNYALIDADDDSNDIDDFISRKRKKRKVSDSEISPNNELGIYTNTTFSLKRKTHKGECSKPEKEMKTDGNNEVCVLNSTSPIKDSDHGEASTTSICNLIDSICNGGEDITSKEKPKPARTRQRKS